MADNKTKTDRIHDLMPKYFRTRQNPNWKALIEAIGESDQDIADLIAEVRKQFFVKTASRPYIDRLGANVLVSRPRLVGMEDSDFRKYIPVLAYQPKQVKLVIDALLDIFFFKESTTAFTQSGAVEPYYLKDGWELNYAIDALHDESIVFRSDDFADMSVATADEIVGSINRQAKYSFATSYYDSLSRTTSVKVFTKTVGAKGSLQIAGGRADISLQFPGFISTAGNQASTIWSITKIGDSITFEHTGGGSPNLSALQIGDVVIIDITGNEGSFAVTDLDVANNQFMFVNPFATAGTWDHGANPNSFVKFFRPEKIVVYNKPLRAITWEVQPGEIVVELPASPPVVRRKLGGSAHINGLVATATDRPSATSLTLDNADDWPTAGGYFALQPLNEIQHHILTPLEDTTTSHTFKSRFDIQDYRYRYTARTGTTLTGIIPDLPDAASVHEITISTANRDANNIVTVNTSTSHGFLAGETVRIRDTVPAVDVDPAINLTNPIDGVHVIETTPSPTSFTYFFLGDEGQSTGGLANVERMGMATAGSTVYLTSAVINGEIKGPYMWDLQAPFVLSALTTTLTSSIQAGDAQRSISVQTNQIPSEEGYLVFDFGTEFEEGPVRYFYKANSSTLNIDPAYIFQQNHDVGSSVTMIRRKGAHVLSGLAHEYPLYVTDPAAARPLLQDLIRKVKSVGIFLNFIVRYPHQYYATIDCYNVGVDPG